MSLFSRRKDHTAAREPEDYSGGPGIKDYSDQPDSTRLAPDDPRKPDSPTDLGKQTWFGVAKRAFAEFKDDNVTDWSAALTYYAVLSIFPGVIVFVSLLGLFGQGPDTVQKLLDVLTNIGVPKDALGSLRGPIEDVVNQQSGKAGLALILGVLGALWSASGYIGAFIRASNAIYEVKEGRKFYILRPLQILVTILGVLLLTFITLALIASGSVAHAIGDAIGLGNTTVTIWNIVKWPLMLVVLALMIAVLYYSTPNVRLRGFKWVSPGAGVAILVALVASAAFAFYVGNFGSYDKTYGTLAGVVIFLIWFWLINLSLLFGIELDAELERTRELKEGVPDAAKEIQLDARDDPKPRQTS